MLPSASQLESKVKMNLNRSVCYISQLYLVDDNFEPVKNKFTISSKIPSSFLKTKRLAWVHSVSFVQNPLQLLLNGGDMDHLNGSTGTATFKPLV